MSITTPVAALAFLFMALYADAAQQHHNPTKDPMPETLERQAALIAHQVTQLGPQERLRIIYIVPVQTREPDDSVPFDALELLFNSIDARTQGTRLVSYVPVRRRTTVEITMVVQHP